MGERLLKSVNNLLSSSLRTREVSRAFLNQSKGAWKRGMKLRILANLLIGLLSRLLRHHDARKLQPVIITFRWLELGAS